MSTKPGFSVVLVTLVGLLVLALVLFLIRPQLTNLSPNASQKNVASPPKVDKSDPKWLDKYCMAEMSKLPDPPFQFTERINPKYPGSSDVETSNARLIPENKRFKTKSCGLTFKYESGAVAYKSLGLNWEGDIRVDNEFEARVDAHLTSKMDSGWKKISPLDDKSTGRPAYGYKGFPLIFTRESPQTGTIDYAVYYFGANALFAHFTVYEK